jgi:predicted RNA-binding protein associated with RNAse of E/G family
MQKLHDRMYVEIKDREEHVDRILRIHDLFVDVAKLVPAKEDEQCICDLAREVHCAEAEVADVRQAIAAGDAASTAADKGGMAGKYVTALDASTDVLKLVRKTLHRAEKAFFR